MTKRSPLAASFLLAAAALSGCGDGEAARLHHEAVVALDAGRWSEAARLADSAAKAGGPEFAGLRAFVHGNVAFARSQEAEADAATLAAENAVASWRVAAASRGDWPQARRNVERGLLHLERLRREAARKSPGAPPPGIPPPAPPPPGPGGVEPAAPAEAAATPLPPEKVLALLEVLRAKEKEKTALRRARRSAAGGEPERDW